MSNAVLVGQNFWDEKKAAAYLGLSVFTLRNDRVTRTIGIPFYRLGKSIRYRPEDLVAWLDSRRVAA